MKLIRKLELLAGDYLSQVCLVNEYVESMDST